MVWQDVRLAVRSAVKDPLYAAVAVATLAVGIGAVTGIFTVVDRVLLRPLPYPEADALVELVGIDPEEPGDFGPHAWPTFQDLAQGASGIELAAYHETTGVFLDGGSAETILGSAVSHNLFGILGVEPLLGRAFTPEEDVFEGPRVLMLSHSLWQTRFGGDRGVVDRTIRVGQESYSVVGVMPPGFGFPTASEAYWVPLHEDETLVRAGIARGHRGLNYLGAVGRLERGMARDGAAASLQAHVAGLAELHDQMQADRSVDLVPLHDFRTQSVPGALLLFLWASILVLAISCANVANVTLSRGVARGRELAVRAALGGSSYRQVRLVIIETLAMGAGGALLGVGLGHRTSRDVR